MLNLSKQQEQAIQHQGHNLVLGSAGTGKTTVLCKRVQHLLDQGIEARDIAVVLFTYKACSHIKLALQECFGERAEHVTVVTLRDLCLETLKNLELDEAIADGQDMRRILRYAMKDIEFSGTVKEAEHIIRRFYGMSHDPQENERHADLYFAYKGFMKQYDLIDRFALIHKSLSLIDSGEAMKVPYKHILVPHAHEATPAQLLWLLSHENSAELTFFADDNQQLFAHDGAVGANVIKTVTEEHKFKLFRLETNFVQEQNIGQMAENFVAGAKGYVQKKVQFSRTGKGQFQVRPYKTYADEVAGLLSLVHETLSDDKKNIAILTRHDREAQRIERVLKTKGYGDVLASRATPIWEFPGAIIVLDILDLLFDQAKPQQLMNILTSFGISHSLAQILFREGMVSEKWLAEGAPVPKGLDLPKNVFSELQMVRSMLTKPYEILKNQQAPSRDVFKSIVFDLLQNLGEEHKRDALIATECVLTFEGKVRELPSVAKKTFSEFSKSKRIVVSPIHVSQGLSFDVVMVPFVCAERFPFTGYTSLGKNLNHDRRLMYQALTRSRQQIILSCHGEASPFVDELKALFAQIKS